MRFSQHLPGVIYNNYHLTTNQENAMKVRFNAREFLYYLLGLLLIAGFVYLYSSRFIFETSMPPAIASLLFRSGREWVILINAGVFIFFLAFLPYRRGIAWRSKGVFAAFILALMAEMFGIPLLLFILSPFLPAVLPDTSLRLTFSTWLGQRGMGVMSSFGQILGAWLTLFGMLLVFVGWKMIHQSKGLVTTGIYRFIRHPQYTGIFLILTGWVIHWPTLPTLLMYPILLFAYNRLARKEENEMIAEFGEAYLHYRETTPGFFPVVFRR
jgi:protein-S-isoprenylcysteine O-methyltransferase Ste14